MNTVTIDNDNLSEYKFLIPEDRVENVSREYYRVFAICDDDQKPVGACMYKLLYLENNTEDTRALLESVFVDPGHRGKGCGRALMEELKKRLAGDAVKSIFFEIPKAGNEEAVGFFKKFGFSIEEKEADRIRIKVEDLLKSPVSKKFKDSDAIGDLESIPVRKIRSGIMNAVFSGRKDIEEDLLSLPFSWYQVQLSSYTIKDNKVTALFLIHQKSEKVYEPMLLFALEPGANKDMLNMVRLTVDMALDKCPKDMEIIVNRRTPAIKKLTAGLFPWIKGENAYKGHREEK